MKTVKKVWGKKEDIIIIKNYKTKNTKELQKLLNNRTINAIKRRADILGIKKYARKRSGKKNKIRKDGWTEQEITLLKEKWDSVEPSEWIHLLPNRTYASIKKRARIFNLKRDLSKYSKKKIFECIECHKTFEGYGNKILCSINCTAKHMAKTRIGENNPAFKPDKDIKANCENCGLEFTYQKGGHHKEQERKYCSRACNAEYHMGEKAPGWMGGLSKMPYSKEFNKTLKKKIKDRDSNKCMLCGTEENITVHHVDYDKMNSDESNLVTLCKMCHLLTNHHRVFWQHAFEFIMSGCQVVKKGWGFEFIPSSNKDYCLKALVFYPNKRFSDHYHLIKKESWYCLYGKMLAKMTYPSTETKEFIFKKGEVLDITQGESHQLIAIEPTILLEVSTKDDSTDSYRVKRGN